MRALTVAAEGRKADIAKPLKGFGSGVFEVALKYRTDAYRTVYAQQHAGGLRGLFAASSFESRVVRV